MSLLNECPICGAALDPGERCDCEEAKPYSGAAQIRVSGEDVAPFDFRFVLPDPDWGMFVLTPEQRRFVEAVLAKTTDHLDKEEQHD